MKGVNKCYGPLLVLATIFWLSLSVSLDTSALKHDVDYIPLGSETNRGLSSFSSPGFYVRWSASNAPDVSSLKMNQLHWFQSSLNNNKCTFLAHQSNYYTSPTYKRNYVDSVYSSLEFTYSFDSYRYNYISEVSSPSEFARIPCMQTSPFNSVLSSNTNLSDRYPFDDSSLVNIPLADRGPFNNLLPYYYDFDSAYVDGHSIDTSTGVHYNTSLNMSKLVGVPLNKFYHLDIPLGYMDNSTAGDFSLNRVISFHGVFDFSGSGHTFSWNPDLSSDSYFRLYVFGRTESQSVPNSSGYSSQYSDCTTNLISLGFNDFLQLEIDCDMTSQYDFYNGQAMFLLEIRAGSASYVFDTNADWSFSASYFVTDNDETPGASWGHTPTGNNISAAPGSADSLIPGDEDFFSSLTNLFSNIWVLNPFITLFNLFTDGSSCANIPLLASMIHAEETQVCPWFDSTTRNIVTPVIAVLATAILFGFIMRWLTNSSGNYKDDGGSK